MQACWDVQRSTATVDWDRSTHARAHGEQGRYLRGICGLEFARPGEKVWDGIYRLANDLGWNYDDE